MDPVQAEVTTVALQAAGHGFALAGGNALVEHGLLTRPTTDVDLFSDIAGATRQVATAVTEALERAGFTVELTAGLGPGQDDFARFCVTRGGDSVMLNLARDWRADPPVQLSVGPVLGLDDAVASKVVAMMTRGLARDYIDVAAALSRYTRQQLLALALDRDPGLRPEDAQAALQQLDRLPDAEFTAYGLGPEDVHTLREQFRLWPRAVDAPHPEGATRPAAGLDDQRARPGPLPSRDAPTRDTSRDPRRPGRDGGGRER